MCVLLPNVSVSGLLVHVGERVRRVEGSAASESVELTPEVQLVCMFRRFRMALTGLLLTGVALMRRAAAQR